MKVVIITLTALLVLLGLTFLAWHLRRRPRKLNLDYFWNRWQEAQKLCSQEDTWPLAIINADKLVEEALKRRRYKGKTMGEKLVSAQHDIKHNDNIWFAHKLRNKLVNEELNKLKKKDVMDALIGFRDTLKDLGALE